MLTRPAFVSTALEADEGTRMEVDTDSGAGGGLFGADAGLGGIDTHHGLPPYGRPIAVSGTSSASVATPPVSLEQGGPQTTLCHRPRLEETLSWPPPHAGPQIFDDRSGGVVARPEGDHPSGVGGGAGHVEPSYRRPVA